MDDHFDNDILSARRIVLTAADFPPDPEPMPGEGFLSALGIIAAVVILIAAVLA